MIKTLILFATIMYSAKDGSARECDALILAQPRAPAQAFPIEKCEDLSGVALRDARVLGLDPHTAERSEWYVLARTVNGVAAYVIVPARSAP